MPSLEGIHQPGLRQAGDAGDTGILPVNSVSNAELAQAAANTLKGNNTGATANVADLTVAQIRTLLALGTAALAATTDFDAAGAAAAAQAASQPLDTDLTAIAALATTAYGRALLTLADAAALTAALNNATQSLKGLLSSSDKTKLDLSGFEVIDGWTTITNNTTYTSTTWTANKYRRIFLEVDLTSGGGTGVITLVGQSGGTYTSGGVYAAGNGTTGNISSNSQWAFQMLTAAWLEADMFVGNEGVGRRLKFASWCNSYFGAEPIKLAGTGYLTDTTHDITGLVLTMSANATFKARLWGVLT